MRQVWQLPLLVVIKCLPFALTLTIFKPLSFGRPERNPNPTLVCENLRPRRALASIINLVISRRTLFLAGQEAPNVNVMAIVIDEEEASITAANHHHDKKKYYRKKFFVAAVISLSLWDSSIASDYIFRLPVWPRQKKNDSRVAGCHHHH